MVPAKQESRPALGGLDIQLLPEVQSRPVVSRPLLQVQPLARLVGSFIHRQSQALLRKGERIPPQVRLQAHSIYRVPSLVEVIGLD